MRKPLEEYTSGYLKIDMRYAAPTGAIAGIVVGSAAVRNRDDWEDGEELLSRTKPQAGGADFLLEIEASKVNPAMLPVRIPSMCNRLVGESVNSEPTAADKAPVK